MVSPARAPRDGNLLALEILDRLVLRRALQPVRYSVRRKPNRSRRQTGQRCGDRRRSNTGDVIDIALGNRRRGERRAHNDQFHVETIRAEHAPILGG